MPRAAKGQRFGGRAKGTPNKKTATVEELLSRFEDPLIGMAKIAAGDVPCGVCHGKGKTKFQPADKGKSLSERTCQSCYGSGKEKIGPELRGKMLTELAQYKYPKRKAVEMQVTGEDGGPLKSHITIEFVRPK